MIEKISLDDGSYESNLERALELLEQKAPWWTHKEASDPGVTLLELWALLTDIQSGYMDQVKEVHYRQYLKLAGVKPDEGEKARAWVCVGNVKKNMILPKGTKMLAGEVVFETGEEELLTDNAIIAFRPGGSSGEQEDSDTLFMGVSHQYGYPLMREEDGALFYLYLRRGLKMGESLRLLVLVEADEERNPPDRDDFYLARLCWEYQTDEGWERLETASDGTCGLLVSGYVMLSRTWSGKGGENRNLSDFIIRCRIEEGSFDRMPVLQNIILNAVMVIQQDTLCSTLYFTYNDGPGEEQSGRPKEENSQERSESALFSDYAALTGEMEVFIRTKEGDWELCEGENSSSCGKGAGEKLRFIGRSLEDGWQNRTVVKVVCRHPDFAVMNPPLEITGAAGQRISLPWSNVCRDSLRLQLKQGAGSRIFREYVCSSQESTVPCAWHWGEEPETILLGDGRHGCIPEASWEEGLKEDEPERPYRRDGLCITSLVLWDGSKGNVSVGRICAWEKPEMFEGLTLCNPLPASGGRDRLTAREQFAGLQVNLSLPHCAVTVEDYARLAEKTPGLIIPRAAARRDGTRLVVNIQLPGTDADSWIKEAYIREVARYLERQRLINTELVVGIEEKVIEE